MTEPPRADPPRADPALPRSARALVAVWPRVDERRCTNCGDCLACCPTDCLERSAPAWSRTAGADALVPVVSVPEACVHCGVCALVCPADAVELVRRDGTVVSLAELALCDS